MASTSRHKKRLGSLADQVYEHLRADIIYGRLLPDERLVELEIAANMGTSQGPVREALQRLEREGLVERRAHRATFVTPISPQEIYEYFEIRRVVEGFAMRHAMVYIGESECNVLQGLVDEMQHAGQADDMARLVESDMAFHRHICEWSGSVVLLETWKPLYSQIQRFVAQNHRRYFADLAEIADVHQPIVDAVKSGDADTAVRLIQEHMHIWSRLRFEQD